MKKIIFIIGILLCASLAAYAEDPIKKHVHFLSEEVGKRNPLYYQNLERAADYIKNEFKSYGYEPEEQVYTMETRLSEKRPFRNIIATKEGGLEKNKIIVICAHYDTYREAPGADDNASGIAAVLELARLLRKDNLSKTLKFITFTNEELELVSEDSDMGSYRYAKEARKKGEDIEAVICIDMIGYYSDEKGSQRYPPLLNLFYPDVGNFIGIGGDVGSYRLLLDTFTEFKKDSNIPTEFLIAPAPLVPQIMTSDNRSFWAFGYESVWITDTCIYRNPYMHTRSDSYGTLNYQNMSKVIKDIYGYIVKLGGKDNLPDKI